MLIIISMSVEFSDVLFFITKTVNFFDLWVPPSTPISLAIDLSKKKKQVLVSLLIYFYFYFTILDTLAL